MSLHSADHKQIICTQRFHFPIVFEQASGDGEGQGRLACCSPRGFEESDKTEQMNNKNGQINTALHASLSAHEDGLRIE